MPTFLRKLFERYAKRMLTHKVRPSLKEEGIMTIPNEQRVKRWAESLYNDLKKAGVTDDMIRSENDIKILHSQWAEIEGQNVVRQFEKMMKPKKSADVLDLTGKKIDTSKPILGGKNVPEDVVTDTVIIMKKMTPMDAMKEANLVISRKGKYKNLTIDESQDILKKTDDHIFERDIKYDEFGEIIKPDPEDFAHGGRSGLNYLLGEDDQNSRVPFGGGKFVFDAARRKFLELMGGTAAGVTAAKTGLFGLLKGGGKKEVIETLTQVPIKDISGMPVWFKPLVNKVIKEGDDVTKNYATLDRQIVHKTKLPDSKTEVLVTQDLTTGDVVVDIGAGKHGFADGHLGQPVRLEYKASEVIEPSTTGGGYMTKGGENVYPGMSKGALKAEETTGKGMKTKEEFWVEEAEFTGGHPENVKFEDTISEKFGQHGSNFDEVEKFATGKIKKKTAKESLKAERAHWTPEGDMASGGRVPLAGGAIVKGGNWLIKALRGTREAIKKNKEYSPERIKLWVGQIDDQIKNLEAGGKIPDEVIQTIRKDPKFKGLTQFRANDPDLREMEEILLEYGQKHAEGGRVPMIFGGSPGLKAMWQMILKNISKGKKKPIKKLFPKPTIEDKELLKMGEKYNLPGAKSWSAQEVESKLEGIDHIIARLKQDKKILERQAANKAMKDEGLDFLMKQIERDMPDVYGPHLKKYTNIDKDILQMETIKKNLIMKDRKLNATGGRVSLSAGGLAGMLGE